MSNVKFSLLFVGGTKVKEDFKVFNGDLEVKKDIVYTYLKSKSLNVPYLNSVSTFRLYLLDDVIHTIVFF